MKLSPLILYIKFSVLNNNIPVCVHLFFCPLDLASAEVYDPLTPYGNGRLLKVVDHCVGLCVGVDYNDIVLHQSLHAILHSLSLGLRLTTSDSGGALCLSIKD